MRTTTPLRASSSACSGRAPEEGDEVSYDGLAFRVLDIEGSRIERLEVQWLTARRAEPVAADD